jgi:ubiquinone/menaquinone biosynthesis C-methylase UbiE
MKLIEEYEKYWEEQKFSDDFFFNPRNHVLLKIFKKIPGDKKILDVGCGSGSVSLFFSNEGHSVTGIDFSRNSLLKAKDKGLKSLINGDSENLPIKSGIFDIVFCGDLLEHLINPELCLEEVKRVLNKQGFLIFSVPNTGFFGARLLYLFTGQIFNVEASQNPPWKWHHIRFYNIKILKSLLGEFNFSIEKAYGVSFLKNKGVNWSWRLVPLRLTILLMYYLQKITLHKIINLSDNLVVIAVKREI